MFVFEAAIGEGVLYYYKGRMEYGYDSLLKIKKMMTLCFFLNLSMLNEWRIMISWCFPEAFIENDVLDLIISIIVV